MGVREKGEQMTDTLAVLALDAADLALAERWDCENLLLDRHAELETFTHSLEHPFTPEVWASVATGLHPTEHGVKDDAAEWDSLPLRVASRFTSRLPNRWRIRLGKPFREMGHRQEVQRTDADTLFDEGAVFTWPGVGEAPHLSEAWTWTTQAEYGELTENRLRENLAGNTGKELGWLVAMERIDQPVAGVHSHVLDVAGHIYARRAEGLREYYELVDSMVGDVRSEFDRLVVLSDHGIQTEWLDDEEPGAHSMRAMVAATDAVAGDLPASVFDVREWLEPQVEADAREDRDLSVDTARERLQELGYME